MIYGIGTDIVSVARIEAAIARHGMAFPTRILTAQEFQEYTRQSRPAQFLGKRFAAKEAVAKAIGSGLRHPVGWQQITVSHDDAGKPFFLFSSELASYLQQKGVGHHHLSMSDEHEMAVAFVVLEKAALEGING